MLNSIILNILFLHRRYTVVASNVDYEKQQQIKL